MSPLNHTIEEKSINSILEAKIHHQISVYVLMIVGLQYLGTSKVLDARRRGVRIEAYE